MNAAEPKSKLYYGVDEAAGLVGLSRRAMLRSSAVYIKIGRKFFYTKMELDRWMSTAEYETAVKYHDSFTAARS